MAKQQKGTKQAVQTKKQPLQEITENKYAVFGLLGIFLLLVFLAASYQISGDDDLFWHLATGRYIIENKVVPNADVFGHITSGTEWIPFEWGWDVLTYALYNIGGYNGILAFRSLAFCFIFFVYFMLLRKFKVNSFISIGLLTVLLVATMDRLSPRPHIITYIFFSLLLYILMNYKYINREKYQMRLYAIPVIFLLWANSHMGVLAGGLILFVFTISETIIHYKASSFSNSDFKPLTQSELKKLWIISIVSALVLLINPHGIQTYLYAYSHTKMKMLETVNEWQNPFNSKLDLGFIITLYKLFLYAGIIVLLYAYKKKDVFFALIFVAFAVYSVRAIRFTVDYEMIMVAFIAISINYFVMNIKNMGAKNFLNGNVPKGALAAFLIYIISMVPSNAIYDKLMYYRVSGWGVNNDFIPVQLFDFMKETKISGTTYNHFGTGGYLVWSFPGEKNFIDSRNLNDEIFNEYNSIMMMKPGFEKKIEERGIDYVVYLDPDLIRRPNELKGLVTSYLSRNPNWKLVFWDDKSMLFVKDIPKFADVINKYEYKVLDPYSLIFNKAEFDYNVKLDPARTREEIARKTQSEPNGYLFKALNDAANKLLIGL